MLISTGKDFNIYTINEKKAEQARIWRRIKNHDGCRCIKRGWYRCGAV